MTAAGAAALLTACGNSDPKPPREPDAAPDLTILRFALALEYFTADFYERLAAETRLRRPDRDLVSGLHEDEQEHIDALEALSAKLGGTPPERPIPEYDKLLDGTPEAILDRAARIENVGAAAYLGQAPRIQNEDVLAAVLSIHSVEGRHAAGLDHRLGRSFAPDGALARPLDAARARSRLAGYGL